MMRLVRNLIRELIVDAETRINKLDPIAQDAEESDPNSDLSNQMFKARRKFNKMMQIFGNTIVFLQDFSFHEVNKYKILDLKY